MALLHNFISPYQRKSRCSGAWLLLFFAWLPLHQGWAQPASCCQVAKAKGQEAFNKQNYPEAIRNWTSGKRCSDAAANCPDLDKLIQTAQAEQRKQQNSAAERKRQAEAERKRQAEAERQRKAADAKAKAAADAYDIVKTVNTKAAYEAFLNKYPNSRQAADARQRIAELSPPPVPKSPTAKLEADMVRVAGGSFDMGCTSEQKDCGNDEKPVTRVTVSDFYLGKYELTVTEFQQFINATGYKTDADKDGGSYIWTGSTWEKKSGVNWKCDAAGKIRPSSEYDHPVIHVSWNDAIAYCNWRSEKEGLTKVYTTSGDKVTANWNANGYRLPTEAEWEYAARGAEAGAKEGFKYAGSNNLDEVGWYRGNSGDNTHPVGQKKPNQLGLYDMSGNVWEWCWDWYDSGYYAKSNNSHDPRGPESGSYRVLRGGSWNCYPADARVASRSGDSPGNRGVNLGFRLARAVR